MVELERFKIFGDLIDKSGPWVPKNNFWVYFRYPTSRFVELDLSGRGSAQISMALV
jgi:hypothetical protein